MSTHFDLYCETCEEWGPEIRRSPGGTRLVVRTDFGFGPGETAWAEFLIEHEWCSLLLRHEGSRVAREEKT